MAEATRGMVGFCRDESILSRIICWFTRQEWSHTFVVLDHDEDVKDYKVIEAGLGGIIISSLVKYREGHVVHLCQLPMELNIEAGISMAESMLGQKYGYTQLIGFIPVMLLRRLGIPIENPITKGVVCSELVSYFMGAATNQASWRHQANETTPGDVKRKIEVMDGVGCIHFGASAEEEHRDGQ